MNIDIEENIVIKLNVNNCTKGIYLRWINHLGEYCYYLFQKNVRSNAVKNDEVNIINYLRSVDYSDNYHEGTGYTLSKSGQKSIKLYEHLADEELYRHLESLIESVYVDMFTGYDEYNNPQWLRVNISDGTLSRDRNILQDFECILLLPVLQNQSL